MHIFINKKCVCRRGKKDTFIRGKEYLVTCLFQMEDGEFMVSVESEPNWTVNCYASRFILPKVKFSL